MRTLVFITLTLLCFPGFALKPQKTYIKTPDSLGLAYESNEITTTDSFRIKSWLLFPDEARDRNTTIIIAGGDAGNMSYYLHQAYFLVKHGYTVVTFDYRGFGKSSDFEINEAFLYYTEFAEDLESVIRWAKTKYPENKTGVWALSMGTIITPITLQKTVLDFYIAEGLVYNPRKLVQRIKETRNKTVLLPENTANIASFYELIRCPILVFSGTRDQNTITEESKEVTDMQPDRKLITFDGGHLRGFQVLSGRYFGETYIRHINQFVEQITG